MYHQPKTSVIIPAYNSEKYLQKCFDSVHNQSLNEIEIIFIDDGSTDRTPVLLQHFKMEDNRVEVISHSKNLGLGAARNSGMKKATGEFLFFLDSDDYIHPNALEVLYEKAKTENLDILQAQFVKHQKNKKIILPVDLIDLPQPVSGIEYFNAGFFIEPKACVKLWKSSFVAQNDLQFEQGFYEDFYMVFLAHTLAQRINTVSIPLYHYIQRDDSITGQKVTEKHVRDYQKALDKLQALFMNSQLVTPTSVFPAMMMLYTVQLCSMALAVGNSNLYKEVKKFNRELLNRYDSIFRQNKRLSFLKRHFITRKPCMYAQLKKMKNSF